VTVRGDRYLHELAVLSKLYSLSYNNALQPNVEQKTALTTVPHTSMCCVGMYCVQWRCRDLVRGGGGGETTSDFFVAHKTRQS